MDSDKQDSDPLLFCIIKSQLFVDRKEFSGEYTLNMEEELEEKFYEKINIDGKWYEYLMTSSTKILRIELEKLGCRLPNKFDYRYNPYLSPEVREKMAERNATWSLTTSNDAFVLNYYKESEKGKGTPYIIYLSALADISTLLSNYDPKILNMFLKIGEKKLPGISSDWSPLMIAVSQRKSEIVKMLLEKGASPNFSDSMGFTPLMLASFLNETEIIRLLIRYGADVNKWSKNSFSAIIYAIYANARDAIRILTENGADIQLSINPKIFKEKRTFSDTLEFYISTVSLNGLADISLIYKNCGISKQHFSKIRSNRKSTYHPRKETVLQLAIGLRLTLAQTENLLESAGYIFEEKNIVDEIFKKHIANLDYDIMVINEEIWKKTGKAFLKAEK